ncbi:hypothetical protein Q1695_015996 [Nippostrongylus brasiliensis]|nr:hypothetical protein Q1695_015996 [Nippostrongylus brasiliensis]
MSFCFSIVIPLLLFATVTDVDAGALVKCRSMPPALMEQMRLFVYAHRDMNLTLDCKASVEALEAARRIAAGRPSHVDNYWCQYSRVVWDAWPIRDYMNAIHDWMDHDYLDMPWDKIKRTAQLHPKTIYGCAYQTKNAFYGIYIVAVCIYQRRGAETRCFCN